MPDEQFDNDRPQHHWPISQHMETGSIGDLGASFYNFLRGVLKASDQIDARRAARTTSAVKEAAKQNSA